MLASQTLPLREWTYRAPVRIQISLALSTNHVPFVSTKTAYTDLDTAEPDFMNSLSTPESQPLTWSTKWVRDEIWFVGLFCLPGVNLVNSAYLQNLRHHLVFLISLPSTTVFPTPSCRSPYFSACSPFPLYLVELALTQASEYPLAPFPTRSLVRFQVVWQTSC